MRRYCIFHLGLIPRNSWQLVRVGMLESFALVVLRSKWKPREFLILDGAQELTFLTIRDCRSRSSKLRKKRELKILPEFFWKRELAALINCEAKNSRIPRNSLWRSEATRGSQNIKNFQFFGHKNFNFCVLGNLFIQHTKQEIKIFIYFRNKKCSIENGGKKGDRRRNH